VTRGARNRVRGLVEAKTCSLVPVNEFTPSFSTHPYQGTRRRAHSLCAHDQLFQVNAYTHAHTGREVAARAGNNNQGCGRIGVFRVALESSKIAQLDLTVDLNNRPVSEARV
jgi:hypothetical protein